jgi:hypothetical protein
MEAAVAPRNPLLVAKCKQDGPVNWLIGLFTSGKF